MNNFKRWQVSAAAVYSQDMRESVIGNRTTPGKCTSVDITISNFGPLFLVRLLAVLDLTQTSVGDNQIGVHTLKLTGLILSEHNIWRKLFADQATV